MMGKGFVSQVTRIKGMDTSVVCSNKIEDCYKALEFAGIKREDIVEAKSINDIDKALEQGKYAVTDDWQIAIKSGLVDVVLDATGVPETGANIALNSINEGKHIVMLNVE
ncbi:NAD(P)-dependent oxidoreductase, partial [Vibrio parahaemolyticus]|nr:NAD(P)-dependent oxidoreductase [Vibrio parahaemolyticus]